MTFDEVLDQVRELLRQRGRVTYRALKRRFNLDDEYLEDIKGELIKAEGVAVEEDGDVLVWTGEPGERGANSGERESAVQESGVAPRSTLDAARTEGERRQLTVMFCDLVGSTALSERLDPEELREVVRNYQKTSAEIINRYAGHIAQYLGDGLLMYFGYPQAHEDDAARAVRAGLEIVESLQGQSVGARCNVPLQVRIGIHTGLVVVGEMGGGDKREQLALGETPNIAARVQGHAEPNTVVMSAATYRLVQGLFECEDRGQPKLKGVTTPLTLYRVLKEGEAQSRFQVVARRGLTPLIGRDHEYGLLQERWARAKEGEGQVVLLSGEPGIGKSRLVEALKGTIEHEGARCLELRCSPYTQNSALVPVIEHLQRLLQFRADDTSEEKLRKLAVGAHTGSALRSPDTAAGCAPLQKDAIPLLAALLSLPHPEGYPALSLSPQKQKEKTHEVLVAWLGTEAKQQAVTYAWEDLHWADPSTLELLTLFLAQVPTRRLLAVLTFRPEFTPPWGAHSYLSQLTLSRLGQRHVETMIEKVTGDKALPSAVIQQIVRKTDGVPLFVEELTKAVMESVEATTDSALRSPDTAAGRSPLQLEIPATLHDSLMARLDRLGPAKEIAQMGATIGREFTYELLQAVSPLNEESLQRGLKQLVEAELVYQSGLPPQARYLFKHALVQDTAYQSLLKSRRQQLHQQVAQVLAEQFPETVESQPELVAQHYTEAGLIEQAIPHWQQAGERATQRSAHVEAIAHLTKGLELLKSFPATLERTEQELGLQIALTTPLIATKGYTAQEVERVSYRARELCQQMRETPKLFAVIGQLQSLHLNRGELQAACELAMQLLRLAQRAEKPRLLLWAHYALGFTLIGQGELVAARTHLEQSIAFYDPQHPHLSDFVQDPKVTGLALLAWVLYALGYADQARRRTTEALFCARQLSHPFSLAFTLQYAADINKRLGEEKTARDLELELLILSREQEFTFWLTEGSLRQGEMLIEEGRSEEGVAQMRQAVATLRAMGEGGSLPYSLYRLANGYNKAGQIEKGLRTLDEAFAIAHRNGDVLTEMELHRLKGTLTLQLFKVQGSKFKVEKSLRSEVRSSESEAEECFLKAIETSRRQQAKSLELRAVMSLSRLWQQQGKQKEAHQMLVEIYNWFTEGFDTKDLQEAKALLETLA